MTIQFNINALDNDATLTGQNVADYAEANANTQTIAHFGGVAGLRREAKRQWRRAGRLVSVKRERAALDRALASFGRAEGAMRTTHGEFVSIAKTRACYELKYQPGADQSIGIMVLLGN